MAEFKFYDIKKANAEVDRLTAELTTAKAKISEIESSGASNSSELVAQAEALQSKLTADESSISTLTSEKATLSSKITTLETAANGFAVKEAAMEKTIEEKAAARALMIVAGTGTQTPLATNPNPNPGQPNIDNSKLKGRSRISAAITAGQKK